jgi:hypothetical protein
LAANGETSSILAITVCVGTILSGRTRILAAVGEALRISGNTHEEHTRQATLGAKRGDETICVPDVSGAEMKSTDDKAVAIDRRTAQ